MKKYFIVISVDRYNGDQPVYGYYIGFTISHGIRIFREMTNPVSLHAITAENYEHAVSIGNSLISSL